MGLLAAIAGMVTVARLNSANPTAGNSYEMDAIGACFIGGASAYGGTGTVPGVIVGATLMGVLNLGMSIMGVDQNLQKVVKAGVLLAAIIFDVDVYKRQEQEASLAAKCAVLLGLGEEIEEVQDLSLIHI